VTDQDNTEFEQQFVESWGFIDEFYGDLVPIPSWAKLEPIFGLIRELRMRGYDCQFRAGQSIYLFILSRSKQQGLRDDQAFLRINLVVEGHAMLVTYLEPPNDPIEIAFDRVEITPAFEQLLERLLAHPID
jgi:hypothetical protein